MQRIRYSNLISANRALCGRWVDPNQDLKVVPEPPLVPKYRGQTQRSQTFRSGHSTRKRQETQREILPPAPFFVKLQVTTAETAASVPASAPRSTTAATPGSPASIRLPGALSSRPVPSPPLALPPTPTTFVARKTGVSRPLLGTASRLTVSRGGPACPRPSLAGVCARSSSRSTPLGTSRTSRWLSSRGTSALAPWR